MSRKTLTLKQFIAYSSQAFIFLILLPLFFVILLPYTRVRLAIKKRLGRKPSILWAPIPIIDIAANRLADRAVGYTSDCLVYRAANITQSSLFDYDLSRYFRSRLRTLLMPFGVLVWAGLRFDIFHFFYCGGFLHHNPWLVKPEFLFWSLIGKMVIVRAFGGDVRQESITRQLGTYHAYLDMTTDQITKETGLTEQQIQLRVKWVIRWSTVALSMGDMIEYTPGSKNDVFYWAIDTDDWKPVPQEARRAIVILHAPNHPHYKGTRFLLTVIERLQKEGYPIKFVLIQNITNEQARKYYEQADIIAEQFIIGWYGFFAVEAMALGKPVLSYIRKPEYLPRGIDCPIVNTNPDNLYENLVELIKNPNLRRELGERGRRYVGMVHSLPSVGARFSALYRTFF